MQQYLWFGAGLLVISLLTVGLLKANRIGLGWFPLWAVVRAVVQLIVIALLLHGILSVPWTVAAFIVLMLSTASWTAQNRLKELWHGRRAAVVGVLAGAVSTLTVIFALRLIDFQVRYLIAVGGIVIGNAMSASTLAGRNFLRAARAGTPEIEGWLAMGATPPQAHVAIGREAVRESMLPNLDQTKSTGLVTLPGAFVGALFGGASPIVAAMFQLVVLAGLGLTSAITALVVTSIVGRSPFLPVTNPEQ